MLAGSGTLVYVLRVMRLQVGDRTQVQVGRVSVGSLRASRYQTLLALNVAMDLEPFTRINPCGYSGLQTTDLRSLGFSAEWDEAASYLAGRLSAHLVP